MTDAGPAMTPDVSLLDEADWAVSSTGVLYTDPPLVIDALTFTVPADLRPLFEHLTSVETVDMDALVDFVAEVSGVEFDSFEGAATVLVPPGEFAARVGSLLGELVHAAGVTFEDGDLAAMLADVRLPVFGSQFHRGKPIKEWGEAAGAVLASVGVLAGTHGPALLLLMGPAGAIITLGTYGTLGGIWVANRLRQRGKDRRAARAAASPRPRPRRRPSLSRPLTRSLPSLSKRTRRYSMRSPRRGRDV